MGQFIGGYMFETDPCYAAENGILLVPKKDKTGVNGYVPITPFISWLMDNGMQKAALDLQARLVDAKIEYVDYKGV
jgi:hypothetical protein